MAWNHPDRPWREDRPGEWSRVVSNRKETIQVIDGKTYHQYLSGYSRIEWRWVDGQQVPITPQEIMGQSPHWSEWREVEVIQAKAAVDYPLLADVMTKTSQYRGFTLKWTSIHATTSVWSDGKRVHSAKDHSAAKAWCDEHAY